MALKPVKKMAILAVKWNLLKCEMDANFET